MTQLRYRLPYLDSSVYISAINNDPDRVPIIKEILGAADRGEIQIVASTWVATEVAKLKGTANPLSADHAKAINAILRSERILWVEHDLNLAFEAQRLVREHGLKPGDAAHLAAAIKAKADVLLRYDNRFTASGPIPGLTICDPYWYGDVGMFDVAKLDKEGETDPT